MNWSHGVERFALSECSFYYIYVCGYRLAVTLYYMRFKPQPVWQQLYIKDINESSQKDMITSILTHAFISRHIN